MARRIALSMAVAAALAAPGCQSAGAGDAAAPGEPIAAGGDTADVAALEQVTLEVLGMT